MKEEYLLKPNKRYLDTEADIKTIKLMTTRMINPVIKDKLSNRGISLIFNTYSGYDSEYELISSLNKTNELLSIQLAVNTGMYIKVPIIDKESLKTTDFNERFTMRWGESDLVNMCFSSMDNIIKDLRFLQYKEQDILINKLITHLDQEDCGGVINNKYKLYNFKKTEVKTLIKYVDSYTSTDLFKDSDSLKNEEHEKA